MKWSQASPLAWSGIATQWNTAALSNSISIAATLDGSTTNRVVKSESISFAASVTDALANNHTMPESVSMAVELAQTGVGGFVFSDSITLAATANYTQSDDATLVNSITIAATVDEINNLNYSESITLASEQSIFPGEFYANSISLESTAGLTMTDSFLWNEVSDTSTTWTKVDYPN